MQLTKDDFDKIRQIVRQEIGNETKAVQDEITGRITMSNSRIREEIRGLKDRVKNFEIRLSGTQDDEDDIL